MIFDYAKEYAKDKTTDIKSLELEEIEKLKMIFYFNSSSVSEPHDYFDQMSDEENQRRFDEDVVRYVVESYYTEKQIYSEHLPIYDD